MPKYKILVSLLGLERKQEIDLSGLTPNEIEALLNLIRAMKHN